MEKHYTKNMGEITYVYDVNLEEYKKVIEKQQKRIAELEQELAELKEKDNYHLRYELAGADETITNLKQQLAEKEEELLKQKEKSARTEQIYNEIIVDKDKEIEKLKQQYTILENENGKLTTELIMDKYKKAQKEVSFGKQLAIQELEKVKIMAGNLLEKFCSSWEYHQKYMRGHRHIEYYDLIQGIDNQIKELKGE